MSTAPHHVLLYVLFSGVGGVKRDNVYVLFFYHSKIKCREEEIIIVSEGHTFLSEEVWMNGSGVKPMCSVLGVILYKSQPIS